MKYLNCLGAALLFTIISGCSSGGSSIELNSMANTNTGPPTNNTTDAGISSEPSNDQPFDAGDTDMASGDSNGGTDTNADGATDSTTTTTGIGSDSPSDTSDGGNTSGTGNNSSESSDAAGKAGDTDSSSDTNGGIDTDSDSGGSDTNGGVKSEDGSNTGAGMGTDGGSTDVTDPAIDPDSALGQLQSRIKILTGRTLLALNKSLSQGEMLSAQQEQCLGSYDPAIGEPLLSIDCDQPLATGEIPIFAGVASLNDTPECRTSLQNANADKCAVDQAQMNLNPIFVVPETGRPQLKQAGAELSYNIVQDRLTLQNSTLALTGKFFCEYDLNNGDTVGGNLGGYCHNQLNRISDLIDENLAIEY